jgi:hypothetical protein|tara:strand:- start:1536 stop:1799 length:264 start_codon:yes stop_codon:yes gene_type:complete
MLESHITDVQLAEGICALLTYVIVWYLFWTKLSFDSSENRYLASALRWISIWIGRKYGTSLYVTLKKKYNIKNYKISLLPNLGINIY